MELKELNRNNIGTRELPIKILQFGEGNFLRAFSDWMIDIMNEKGDYNHGVAVVQPIKHGIVDLLSKQDGLYHHVMRGLKNGQPTTETRMINAVQKAINPFKERELYFAVANSEDLKIVISNTTEAGIVFNPDDALVDGQLPKTFPGKVTQILWERFQAFEGSHESGLCFIPVELIDKNGEKLKEAILQYAASWKLPAEFAAWVGSSNHFANTLVDRIVPGYPKDEIDEIQKDIGFADNLVVSSEIFHLWVMEAPEELQKAFPADKYGLNVIYTKNQTPYRVRKVRVLNGAHTCMVPVGLLHGLEIVSDSVEHDIVGGFIKDIMFGEILPTIDLPQNEKEEFANEVLERFKNPFIRHELKTISLNSIAKFKVRVLPTILDYLKLKGELPQGLLTAFAHLVQLYCSTDFEINDDQGIKDFFASIRNESAEEIASKVLSKEAYWGQDLTQIEGFEQIIVEQIKNIKAGKSITELLAQ
ncbi:MAG: tagaturonate reductase [Reichenbachiella sp.]